jgi:hypothetical protein
MSAYRDELRDVAHATHKDWLYLPVPTRGRLLAAYVRETEFDVQTAAADQLRMRHVFQTLLADVVEARHGTPYDLAKARDALCAALYSLAVHEAEPTVQEDYEAALDDVLAGSEQADQRRQDNAQRGRDYAAMVRA